MDFLMCFMTLPILPLCSNHAFQPSTGNSLVQHHCDVKRQYFQDKCPIVAQIFDMLDMRS